MPDHDPRRAAGGGRHARLRRFLYQLRTERGGPKRDPIAVAIGVFIGCTPLYGLHLLLSLLAADLFRVNRLKVYLAANISNPFVFPFLIFAEVQAGAWLRRGSFHAVTREAISSVSPWVFGLDLVIGSLAVGTALGLAFGSLTYFALRNRNADPNFSALVARAAERFARTSFTAWEFANAKLRADPVYRLAMTNALLPGGAVLVDVGCGQGLMLSLLIEARDALVEARDRLDAAGQTRGFSDWPIYERLVGIESRPRVARLATNALAGPGVEIVTGDARSIPIPACDAVLLFDVLHMMPNEAQEALLVTVKASLRSGGVVLVREADPSSGWRFALVRIGNRVKALAGRQWRQHFAFRRSEDWVACFRTMGFDVDVFPGPASHPFGNTLFRLALTPASPHEAAILSP